MCIIKFDLFYMFPVNCDDVTVFVKVYFESKCTNCIFPTSKGGGGGAKKKTDVKAGNDIGCRFKCRYRQLQESLKNDFGLA